MKTLDVINAALATVGEAPLNAIDNNHPFVVVISRKLKELNRTIQSNKSRGWWFNTETVTLLQEVGGKVPVPTDIIALQCTDRNKKLHPRKGYLYDPSKATNELNIDVEIEAVREQEFDDLPDEAQQAVSTATIYSFQSDYEADGQKTGIQRDLANLAMRDLRSAEITNNRPNTQNNPTIARIVSHSLGSFRR